MKEKDRDSMDFISALQSLGIHGHPHLLLVRTRGLQVDAVRGHHGAGGGG